MTSEENTVMRDPDNEKTEKRKRNAGRQSYIHIKILHAVTMKERTGTA